MITKLLLMGIFVIVGTLQATGTAIYIPAGHSISNKGKSREHHLTLAHLDTTNQTIVDKAIDRIKNCIKTSRYLSDSNYGKVATYSLGHVGFRSTILEGNIEDFKKSLDSYLKLHPLIANHLSPYRTAHVDRYNRQVHYYPQLRLEKLKTVEDH